MGAGCGVLRGAEGPRDAGRQSLLRLVLAVMQAAHKPARALLRPEAGPRLAETRGRSSTALEAVEVLQWRRGRSSTAWGMLLQWRNAPPLPSPSVTSPLRGSPPPRLGPHGPPELPCRLPQANRSPRARTATLTTLSPAFVAPPPPPSASRHRGGLTRSM